MSKIGYNKNKDALYQYNVNQTSAENERRNELTVFDKICFALAGLPYQMYFCAISVFVNVFLLERAKLSPSYTSYVLFISRLTKFDSITILKFILF